MATEPELEAKYANNAKVMVGSAILLLVLILITILFRIHVYLCRRRRLRLFSQHPLPTSTPPIKEEEEQRLDPSVLKSLPTFTYSSSSATLHECAVCLSEFVDGDSGRTLPNCNHAFHSHCIDTWFASHSTCPLCRAPVQPATVSSHPEPCAAVSVSEVGEGCSYFPEPIGCPRKPLRIIVELPEAGNGSDPLPGEHGFKCSLQLVGR